MKRHPDYPSQTRNFSSSSDRKAALAREKLRRFRITQKSRNFRTRLESVPASLHHENPRVIPLDDLAARLGVEPKQLVPCLRHGYIKLVSPTPPMVYEPPPAAIEWLKQMFMPLMMRPFLTTEMVCTLMGLQPQHFRTLCLYYNIPLIADPVFGELMSLASFYRFHVELHHYREPSRFDRQAMLKALMYAASPVTAKQDLKLPNYSKRLEREIHRIAKLPEPEKTTAALRVFEAYADAKNITDCIAKMYGKKPPTFKAMDRVARWVMADVVLPPQTETAP
jgi:hypothetical protein